MLVDHNDYSVFDKDANATVDYWPKSPTFPCDHSHNSCQHCEHFCGGCSMFYCCKCGQTWGNWTITYADPPCTATAPGYEWKADHTCCHGA